MSTPNTPFTPATATLAAFQELLDAVRRDEALLEQLSNPEETPEFAPPPDLTESVEPAALPPVSDAAVELIIVFEVTSRAVYERKYRKPIWPRGRSGVTIGIGYDIGHATPAQLQHDWSPYLAQPDLDTLSQACGITGPDAAALVPRLAHIEIAYDDAHAVFKDVSLPSYTRLTVRALPNTSALHPDSLGALVSLVYNRGASFSSAGERYREMREIRAAMAERRVADIPAQIRSMKRLWEGDPDSAGLLKRRELEARLFEHGLAQG